MCIKGLPFMGGGGVGGSIKEGYKQTYNDAQQK